MLQRVRFEEAPARAIMQRMFDQQMDILYKYRFFYRELSRLIDRDPVLHSRFRTFRAQQLSAGQELLNRLVDDGILRPPRTDDEYTTLTKITWCVSTQWPEYAESFLELSEEQAMAEGKTVSLSILNPYFTEKGRSTF
jgi:hypothetical protein